MNKKSTIKYYWDDKVNEKLIGQVLTGFRDRNRVEKIELKIDAILTPKKFHKFLKDLYKSIPSHFFSKT
jgi:hypothetical protein